MIKKAFILGAGKGTRLRPLTEKLPKPLVPLFHRPMAEYAFDRALDLGIKDLAVNTHHLAEKWEEFYLTSEAPSFSGLNGLQSRPAEYKDAQLQFFQEDDLLETGGGIANLSEWIGEDSVLIYNGDIFCTIPLEPLVQLHEQSDFVATLVLRSDGPAPHIAVDGDKVVDIRNSLGNAEGTHQFTGIYAVRPELLNYLTANKKESVIPAFLELAKQGKLGAVTIDEGEWFDLGTREMYLEAHRSKNLFPEQSTRVEGDVVVAESAQMNDNWISSGAQIGENAVIENSVIWPGAKVEANAHLKDCVVYSQTPVTGTHTGEDL